MTTVLDIVFVVHTIFAALWTGSTLAIAGAVIPAARRELVDAEALALVARRFTYLTLTSVLLLLFTGGHLAGTLYTPETLQSTGGGHLVLTMLALWLALAAILHFGTRRLTGDDAESSGATASTVSTTTTAAIAATAARPWFLGASAVSIALLVVAGLL